MEKPDPRSHQGDADLPGGADQPPGAQWPGGAEPPGSETAYRRLLLCYPRRWREARGEELLGTLLDGAEAAGRTRPSRAEAVDLVVHGLATRCAVGVGVLPAGVRGATAALALAVGAGLSAVCLVMAERQPAVDQRLAAWPTVAHPWTDRGLGPFLTTGPLVFVPWLVALAAAVAGRRRIMLVALVVTYPATGAVLALGRHTDLLRPPLSLLLVLAVLAVPALAGAAATRAPGRPGAGPRGLVAATGAVLGWAALLGAFGYQFGFWTAPGGGFLSTVRLSSTGYWSSSFYGSLAETVPQGLLAGGLLGVIAGVRRPGWVAAVFACGDVLCVLPVLRAWVDHWTFYQRVTQIALTLAVLLSAGLVDAWRAQRILSTKGPAGPAGVPPTLI
nr:hypothetical protein [Parafrankia soli]